MRKTKQVSISLSVKTINELNIICQKFGENRSRTISTLINEKYISDFKNKKNTKEQNSVEDD